MPRLGQQDETTFAGGGFQFSAVSVDKLTETQYTLVTIAVDISGSVGGFDDQLLNMLRAAVEGCKKSPTAENILIRVLTFNSDVTEVHGFRVASGIDPTADYSSLRPYGFTALTRAAYEGFSAIVEYGKNLVAQDFDTNGILFVITDGMDNQSGNITNRMVKEVIEDARKTEQLGAIRSILIGINDVDCRSALTTWQQECGMDEFISMGDVTPGKLAKLGGFVSQSVSSSSQSLITGHAAPAPTLTI